MTGANDAREREWLREAVEACKVAYHHLDRFGVVSGGSDAEHRSQERVFDALRPFASASSEKRKAIDAALSATAAGEKDEPVHVTDQQMLDDFLFNTAPDLAHIAFLSLALWRSKNGTKSRTEQQRDTCDDEADALLVVMRSLWPEARKACVARAVSPARADWREAVEWALGVEADPVNHTPEWCARLIREIREIGNRPVAPPRGPEGAKERVVHRDFHRAMVEKARRDGYARAVEDAAKLVRPSNEALALRIRALVAPSAPPEATK